VTPVRKYLFGLSVAAWLFSVIGLPVYFHYCDGQLEEVTYFMESDGCCDGENNAEEGPDGCCSNEGYYLVNASEGFQKAPSSVPSIKMLGELVCLPFAPFSNLTSPSIISKAASGPAPPLCQAEIISVSVLRI
jgi:hypothetical protein